MAVARRPRPDASRWSMAYSRTLEHADGSAVAICPIDRRGEALGVAEVSGSMASIDRCRRELDALIGGMSAILRREVDGEIRRRELDLGLAWTAHELRGPIHAVRLLLENAASSYDDGTGTTMIRAADELSRLADGLESVLEWAVGRGRVSYRRTDLVGLTQDAIDSCVAETGEDRVVIEGSERLIVSVDALAHALRDREPHPERSAVLHRVARRYASPSSFETASRRSRWRTRGLGYPPRIGRRSSNRLPSVPTVWAPVSDSSWWAGWSGGTEGPSVATSPRRAASRSSFASRSRARHDQDRRVSPALSEHGPGVLPGAGRPLMRVLVVDDHKLFAEAVQLALEKHGMEVVIATSPDEGLEAAVREVTRRGPPRHRPAGS